MMKTILLLAAQLIGSNSTAQNANNDPPAKQEYVGIAAARGNQGGVRVYRVAESGTVELLNDGAARDNWQPIGVPLRAKQKCVGIAAVRISPQVIRLYRVSIDGSVHILDDGGNPKTNTWQAIGMNTPRKGRKYVGVSAVRISQRVVRVYRTLDNGAVEILDNGGNAKATWQPLRK